MSSKTKELIVTLKQNGHLIESTAFKGKLDLADCQLGIVSENELKEFFSYLLETYPDLRQLDLSRNELKFLPENIGEFKQLHTINLNFNQLTKIPGTIGNLAQLTRVLALKNDLTELPAEFYHLKQLTHLSLSHNQFTCLRKKAEWDCLEVLNLSDNQFSSLPRAVKTLPQLKVLDISGNPLGSLDGQAFSSLKNLEKLLICQTPITHLPTSWPPRKSLEITWTPTQDGSIYTFTPNNQHVTETLGGVNRSYVDRIKSDQESERSR